MKSLIYLFLLLLPAMAATAQKNRTQKYRTRTDEPAALKADRKSMREANWVANRAKRKEKRRRPGAVRVLFSPEATLFYNLNANDVQGTGGTAAMVSKGTAGFATGLGARLERNIPVSFFLSGYFGLRVVPQQLSINAPVRPSVEKFTNTYGYFKLMGGFKFPLSTGHGMDVALGFQNMLPFNNRMEKERLVYTPYTDATSGETINQLRTATAISWGHHQDFPVLLSPTIQLAYSDYTLLGNRKMIRLAVEFSFSVNDQDNFYNNNSALYYEFDADRKVIRSEKFHDRHLALGLNLSVGI